jgi:uncharacterized protein YjdB
MRKRIFALLIALVVLVGLLPMSALAEGTDPDIPFVYSYGVSDRRAYVLAYNNGKGYDVVANNGGTLAVEPLTELTKATVTESMLWTVSVDSGYALENSGMYLTAKGGSIALTDTRTDAWNYDGWEGDVYYATPSEVHLLTVANSGVYAYDGDYYAADGRVAFYARQGEEVSSLPPAIAPSLDAESGAAKEAADDGLTVLAFTSDTHNKEGNVAATRLGTWLDKMEGIYGKKVDVMAFGGDMANASASESAFWTLTQADMNQLANKGVTGVYTTGNHEYSPGSYTHDKNDTTKKYIENAEGKVGDNYRIYCLGSSAYAESSGGGSWWGVGGGWNEYSSSQISTLSEYLESVDNSKPIIIITHYPLHYTSSRTISGAGDVIDALNLAADSGKKIVYLWGHNHTDAPRTETNYDKIFKPGDTITYSNGSSKTIQFYYGAAGCMSDSEYGTGSGSVKGKGLVITINSENKLSFTYYNEIGTNVTEGGTFTERDPVAIENVTINEVPGTGSGELPTIEVRKTLQLRYTVQPADATVKTVTWKSSDTTVATVDSTGKVKGVSAGRATITATVSDGITRGTADASIEITVNPRSAGGTLYVLTDALEDGESYLIVSAKTEGDAFALTNNGSNSSGTAMGSTAVEILSGDLDGDGVAELYIDTDEENIVWETTANGSGYNLTNDDGYLEGVQGAVKVFNPQYYPTRYWTYSNEYLEHKGGSYTYEVFYDGSGFAYRNYNSGSARNHIYIFEQQEIGTADVTGVSLNKSTLELAQGASEKLVATVAPANAANKNVTWSSSNSQVASVSSAGVVTAVTTGTAVITVTTVDGEFTATCNVTVSEEVVTEYVLAETLEAGKNYLIATGNSGSVYIVSNEAAGSRHLKGVSVNVVDGKIAISDSVAATTVFKCYLEDTSNANSTRLKIGTTDLYTNNADGLRMFEMTTDEAGKHWHYRGENKNLLWFFKDTDSSDGYTDTSNTYKYYLECTDGIFTDNHVSNTSLSNSNTPKIYLFVEKIPVTGVTVDPTTAAIAIGEETQLTATVAPEIASIQTVTWSSSDTAIATVDSTGKVTGKAAGTATITATTTDGGYKDSCEVTVSTVAVTGVSLDKTSVTLEIGRETELIATVLPENATNKNVSWSSSNDAVATVENGIVEGIAEGTAVITVTTEDGGETATCSVTVIQPIVRAGYVITIADSGTVYALSNETEEYYHTESNGSNKYYGLKGVAYTTEVEQAQPQNILWQLTPVLDDDEKIVGYYIQDMDGNYLNATYNGVEPYLGELKVDATPDIWKLDASLEDWIVNGSYLQSTNATVTGTNAKELCLAFESKGQNVDGQPYNGSNIQLFTIRSRSNADSSEISSPDLTVEIRYEEVSEFTDGEEYLIGVDTGNGGVYALQNNSNNIRSVTISSEDVHSGDPDYIISRLTGINWKYTSSNKYLINSSRYLTRSNGNLSTSSSSGNLIGYMEDTSGPAVKHYLTMKSTSGSSNTYYLTCSSSGTFGVSSANSTSNAADVRLFEKKIIITYDVKWIGANGAVLYHDEYGKGEIPQYSGATPEKPDDEQYTYTFAGWSDGTNTYGLEEDLPAVTGITVYTAVFTATEKGVGPTITFLDSDGTTEIAKVTVAPGTEWGEFDLPDNPQKTGYTFTGWDGAPTIITEDVTVTATYSANLYMIKFVDDDGTELQSSEVAYGETPEYAGEAPTKEATAQYTYEFAGWSPAIAEVTGNATYTATYTSTVNKYTVTFVDEDGETVLKEATEYDYGTAAADIVKPADPTKEATAQYTYTFAGWDPEIAAVTGDATYTATYTATFTEYIPSNIESNTVNFDGKLFLITYIKLSDDVMADANAYVSVTFNGKTTKHSVAKLIQQLDGQGRVSVWQELFAAMMRDKMTLQVFNGKDEVQPLKYKGGDTNVTDSFVYSALDYLKDRQENSTNPKMRELARAAELYGTAVQVYFNYKTDQLTTKDIAAMEAAAVEISIPQSCEEVLTGTLPDGVKKRTKTVMFESDNTLRQYYYIDDESIGNYTFTLNDDTVEPERAESGKYYVDQPNIASGLLSKEYTFIVSDGTNTFKISSSALGYAYDRQQKSQKQDMVNLAKLLYRYSLAADAYFDGSN